MQASFSTADSFKILSANYTALFVVGRKMKFKSGTIGSYTYSYGSIKSVEMSGIDTLVTINTLDEDLTSTLVEVAWAEEKPGDEGSASSKWFLGWVDIELLEDAADDVVLVSDVASSETADGLHTLLKRSKGTFDAPAVLVGGENVSVGTTKVYAGSSPGYQDATIDTEEVVSVSDTHALIKRTLQRDNGTTGMVVCKREYGDGAFDYPNQSMVKATKADAQSFSDTVESLVLYNNEVYDNQEEFNPSTGIFTVKRNGVYSFSAQITFAATTEVGTFELRAKKGAVVVATGIACKDATASSISLQLNFDLSLVATDTVSFFGYFNDISSNAITLLADATANFLSIRKIG